VHNPAHLLFEEFLAIRVVWLVVELIGQLSSQTTCPLRVVTLLCWHGSHATLDHIISWFIIVCCKPYIPCHKEPKLAEMK